MLKTIELYSGLNNSKAVCPQKCSHCEFGNRDYSKEIIFSDKVVDGYSRLEKALLDNHHKVHNLIIAGNPKLIKKSSLPKFDLNVLDHSVCFTVSDFLKFDNDYKHAFDLLSESKKNEDLIKLIFGFEDQNVDLFNLNDEFISSYTDVLASYIANIDRFAENKIQNTLNIQFDGNYIGQDKFDMISKNKFMTLAILEKLITQVPLNPKIDDASFDMDYGTADCARGGVYTLIDKKLVNSIFFRYINSKGDDTVELGDEIESFSFFPDNVLVNHNTFAKKAGGEFISYSKFDEILNSYNQNGEFKLK